MTELDLTMMAGRAAAAIAGPWRYHWARRSPRLETATGRELAICRLVPGRPTPVPPDFEATARFLAAAREDVPLLVAEVRRCWAQIARLRADNMRLGGMVRNAQRA